MSAYRAILQTKDQPILVCNQLYGATNRSLAEGDQIGSQFKAGKSAGFTTLSASGRANRTARSGVLVAVKADQGESKNLLLESLHGGARCFNSHFLPTEKGCANWRGEKHGRESHAGRASICGLQWSLFKNRIFSSETFSGKLLPSISKSFSNALMRVVANPAAISESPCSASGIPFHPQTRRALTAVTRKAP